MDVNSEGSISDPSIHVKGKFYRMRKKGELKVICPPPPPPDREASARRLYDLLQGGHRGVIQDVVHEGVRWMIWVSERTQGERSLCVKVVAGEREVEHQTPFAIFHEGGWRMRYTFPQFNGWHSRTSEAIHTWLDQGRGNK